MKSEAQAYQAIRRDWKRRLNNAQRAQNIYMWEAINGTKHPTIVRFVAKSMGSSSFPKVDSEICRKQAQVHQDKISMYQNWLNQYKVDSND